MRSRTRRRHTASAKLANVHAAYLDEPQQLDTEVTPGFIGADDLWDELGGQGSAGEGIVVAVLDTGVWPEHPSYSDPDPGGKGYAPPSTAPGSNGFGSFGPTPTCDFGNTGSNTDGAPFTCNNKLIGAYQFTNTYIAVIGLLPDEYAWARDADGHGTHIWSTAAGNGVAASIFAVDRGTVSGIAPRAHMIMYKVCADQGCFGSDSVRAVEQAILDEVDVLSFSINGGNDPLRRYSVPSISCCLRCGCSRHPLGRQRGSRRRHRLPPRAMDHDGGCKHERRHFISAVSLEADKPARQFRLRPVDVPRAQRTQMRPTQQILR